MDNLTASASLAPCCCLLQLPPGAWRLAHLSPACPRQVLEWRERGVNVECVRRTNRQGYKAGAMKEVRGWLVY